MRIIVQGNLKKERLSLEYRKGFLSYIKRALESSDKALYDKLYQGHNAQMKGFASAFSIGGGKVEKGNLILNNTDVKMILTTHDMALGIGLYNAMLKMKGTEYPIGDNHFVSYAISISQSKYINQNDINVKFISPLLVRSSEKHESYLKVEDDLFTQELVKNTEEQMKRQGIIGQGDSIDLKVKFIRPKKLIIRHYGQMLDGYIGTFKLKGNPALLSYLYEAGLGSRKSAGFGVFEIL